MCRLRLLLLTAAVLGAGPGLSIAGAATPPSPLTSVQVDMLPGVQHRIDHFAVDAAGQRLFVAALGNPMRTTCDSMRPPASYMLVTVTVRLG